MDAHFRTTHPEYNQWRDRFQWKLIPSLLAPFVAIVLIGVVWGFTTFYGYSLQFAILILSLVPLLLVFIRLALANRKFRREWVTSHGRANKESVNF